MNASAAAFVERQIVRVGTYVSSATYPLVMELPNGYRFDPIQKMPMEELLETETAIGDERTWFRLNLDIPAMLREIARAETVNYPSSLMFTRVEAHSLTTHCKNLEAEFEEPNLRYKLIIGLPFCEEFIGGALEFAEYDVKWMESETMYKWDYALYDPRCPPITAPMVSGFRVSVVYNVYYDPENAKSAKAIAQAQPMWVSPMPTFFLPMRPPFIPKYFGLAVERKRFHDATAHHDNILVIHDDEQAMIALLGKLNYIKVWLANQNSPIAIHIHKATYVNDSSTSDSEDERTPDPMNTYLIRHRIVLCNNPQVNKIHNMIVAYLINPRPSRVNMLVAEV